MQIINILFINFIHNDINAINIQPNGQTNLLNAYCKHLNAEVSGRHNVGRHEFYTNYINIGHLSTESTDSRGIRFQYDNGQTTRSKIYSAPNGTLRIYTNTAGTSDATKQILYLADGATGSSPSTFDGIAQMARYA